MTRLVLCLLLLTTPAHAAPSLWGAWDLVLGTHPPPRGFLLSVTSSDVPDTPLPMPVPWARCTAVPGAAHCAPIGCPGVGTYTFWAQADYGADGLSARSNIATCRSSGRLTCTCLSAGAEGPPADPDPPPALPLPPPPGPDAPPPADLGLTDEVPPLSEEVPPLPQQGPEGLDLHDPSEGLPGVPQPPPVPPCEYYCDRY
jgi:hypothetical protein